MSIIHVDYDKYVALQYRVKSLDKINVAFESGVQYEKLKEGNRRIRCHYEKVIKQLEDKVNRLRKALDQVREMWFEVFEDMQKEDAKKEARRQKEISKADEKIRKAELKENELKNKLKEKNNELVKERAAKIDAEEKIDALEERLGLNFENSSIPSSQDSFRKKVPNNRKPTGNKPGAQKGHPGHGRRDFSHITPVETINLEAPKEIIENPDYYMTESQKIHKKIDFDGKLIVIDYVAPIYRNRKTGGRYQPTFPDNLNLEVNYGEGIKAIVFLMKNYLNCSEDSIIEFLSWMTGGELRLSRGFVNGINAEFAGKAKPERNQIFSELSKSAVLYADMTCCRKNGELKYVTVCTDKKSVMYSFHEHKGDKGFTGTPVQIFHNILVHDHDLTMYHYAEHHQECNAHHLRYLKGAIEQEPNLTWHRKMYDLFNEMNDTRNAQKRILDKIQIENFEKRYLEILDLANKEYFDNPPTKYYTKGFNLSVEFRDYMTHVLFFLRHPEVDFTNNEAERCCRKIKRHMVISGTFRGCSNQSAEDYCVSMSVLQTWRIRNGNILELLKEVFRRKRPEKINIQKTMNAETAIAS